MLRIRRVPLPGAGCRGRRRVAPWARSGSRQRATVAALLALALVVSGCGGDDSDEEAGPQVSRIEDRTTDAAATEPESDPEPAADPDPEPDPEPEPDVDPEVAQPAPDGKDEDLAIPGEIDGAYVDEVVNYIYSETGDFLIGIIEADESRELSGSDVSFLESFYDGEWLHFQTDQYSRYVGGPSGRSSLLEGDEIGRASWRTQRVMRADGSCILAIGHYDISRTAVDPPDPSISTAISLSPSNGREANSSPWVIRDQRPLISGGDAVPEGQWDAIDYEELLDSSCD